MTTATTSPWQIPDIARSSPSIKLATNQVNLGTSQNPNIKTVQTSPTGTPVNAGMAAQVGLPTTGSPSLDAIQDQAAAHAQSVIQAGQTINPGLNITPSLVSQFLQEAHAQADPYYQQQLTSEIGNINANLANAQTQYENSVGNSNDTFQQNLDAERDAAGGNGIAFSGERGLAEQYALNAQNRSLSNLGSQAQTDIGNTLRGAGSEIGQGIPGLQGNQSNFQLPSISSNSATLAGARGGTVAGNSLNYNYNPSTYQIGSLGSAYGTDLQNTQNQYQSNYLQGAGNAPAGTYQNLISNPTS